MQWKNVKKTKKGRTRTNTTEKKQVKPADQIFDWPWRMTCTLKERTDHEKGGGGSRVNSRRGRGAERRGCVLKRKKNSSKPKKKQNGESKLGERLSFEQRESIRELFSRAGITEFKQRPGDFSDA